MSETQTTPPIARAIPLGPWLLLALILNLVALSAGGFDPDLECWANWTTHLQNQGYTNLTANYPPMYIHWLWLVAQFYTYFKIPVALGSLIKFWALTPVFVAHLTLLAVLHRFLVRQNAPTSWWMPLMALTCINPAFLMNGPAWGQVDLVFSVMVALVIALLISDKHPRWIFLLIVAALLTKFQTIAIAPVLGGLLWVRKRQLLPGIIPAAILLVLCTLPYLLMGNLLLMIQQAYLGSASTYPFASYNAANLWYLLGLNSMSDIRFLFDMTRDAQGWELIFTPKYFGMGSFSLLSLWLLWDSARHQEAARWWRNAIVSAVGFFLLLPAMHERYLFLAIPIALVAAAQDRRFVPVAFLLTFFNFFNTIWVMAPHGGNLPHALAAGTILFAIVLAFGNKIPWERIAAFTALRTPVWVAACGLLWLLALTDIAGDVIRVERSKDLPPGWIKASQVNGRETEQAWGSLHVDQSVDGAPLHVGGKTYGFGFGTHAASSIRMPVPTGASSFQAKVGVDDECKGGHVEFEVLVDGVSAWKSGPVDGGQDAREIHVPLNGAQRIELKVDPLGSNEFDHADWVETSFQVPIEH